MDEPIRMTPGTFFPWDPARVGSGLEGVMQKTGGPLRGQF